MCCEAQSEQALAGRLGHAETQALTLVRSPVQLSSNGGAHQEHQENIDLNGGEPLSCGMRINRRYHLESTTVSG